MIFWGWGWCVGVGRILDSLMRFPPIPPLYLYIHNHKKITTIAKPFYRGLLPPSLTFIILNLLNLIIKSPNFTVECSSKNNHNKYDHTSQTTNQKQFGFVGIVDIGYNSVGEDEVELH